MFCVLLHVLNVLFLMSYLVILSLTVSIFFQLPLLSRFVPYHTHPHTTHFPLTPLVPLIPVLALFRSYHVTYYISPTFHRPIVFSQF